MHLKMTTQDVWLSESKLMVPFGCFIKLSQYQPKVIEQTCHVRFYYSNMRCLGFLRKQTQNILIHRENRSLIALSKCHYSKLKHMYKLQYVSNSLVSALQSLVKVFIYVQTSVHKATQNRLEH